jgi:cysteine desulfurase
MAAIYLDHHATTPLDPRVRAAMRPWWEENFANPHSAEHAMGRAAEAAVEAAREAVADLIGAEAREIVFTSGATEANNLAIKGAARFQPDTPRRRIITLATEHKCVLESVRDLAAEGFEPVILPVGADGLLDLAALEAALAVPTLLVSVMAVNNETGAIQDLAAIGALVKAHGTLFHTDAAQAAGRIALDVEAVGADLVSLSAHKMYGPKGVGALYVRRRPRVRLAPLFSGGGQERGLRSGTLPAPLLVGMGEAARIAAGEGLLDAGRLAQNGAGFLDALRAAIPGLVLNGPTGAARVPGNLNLTFPGVPAAALLAALPDLMLSTGSACTSAEVAPSHVLTAMGLPSEVALRTLRIGLGRFTSPAELHRAAELIGAAWQRLATTPAAAE